MEIAGRTLTVDVIAALTYRPGVIWVGQKDRPDPVNLKILPPSSTRCCMNFLGGTRWPSREVTRLGAWLRTARRGPAIRAVIDPSSR
jgi:hypothetical protein